MSQYHQTISEATGYTDEKDLYEIEDCAMRDILHAHSLDWATKEVIADAARKAVKVLLRTGDL